MTGSESVNNSVDNLKLVIAWYARIDIMHNPTALCVVNYHRNLVKMARVCVS